MKKIIFLVLILSVMILAAIKSEAGGFGVDVTRQATVSVTTASAKFADADPLRNYLLIQNLGSASVIVKFGSAQSASEGVVIAAGGNYEPLKGVFTSVYMKSSTGTQSVVIVEGH